MRLKAHVAGFQKMYTLGGVRFQEHGQKHNERKTGNFHFKGYPHALRPGGGDPDWYYDCYRRDSFSFDFFTLADRST